MLKKRFFGMMILIVGLMFMFTLSACEEEPTDDGIVDELADYYGEWTQINSYSISISSKYIQFNYSTGGMMYKNQILNYEKVENTGAKKNDYPKGYEFSCETVDVDSLATSSFPVGGSHTYTLYLHKNKKSISWNNSTVFTKK
jgi:hypothetical protein